MLIYENKSINSFVDYGIDKRIVSLLYNERLAFRNRYFQEMIFLMKIINSPFNECVTRYEDYIHSLNEYAVEYKSTVIDILGTPYVFRFLLTTPKVVYKREGRFNISYNTCSRIAIWEAIMNLGGPGNKYRKIHRIKVPYAKKCVLGFQITDLSDQFIKVEKVSIV